MRAWWVVVFVVAGCIESNLIPCGDLSCPAGAMCLLERHTCASPDALAVCAGLPDGTLCQTLGVDGTCDRELCVASDCGDGMTTGREQCDVTVPALRCSDFRYYYGDLACTSACVVDTSGCRGQCGDHLVQSDQGELCDGNAPERGCIELGYDYGHIACTSRCGDNSLTECGHLAPQLVFAGTSEEIADVWRDGDLLVVARGANGLDVIDHGVRSHFAGTFTRIAGTATSIAIGDGSKVVLLAQGALTPLPDLGANNETVAALAYTATGELWALTTACSVRVLSSSSWQARPSPVDSGCKSLAFDAQGQVYVATSTSAWWLNGTAWDKSGAGTVTNVLKLNEGSGGKVLALTASGGWELVGTIAKSTPITGAWLDGISIGDAYFTVGIAPARFLTGRPMIYSTSGPSTTTSNVRRMPDGSVLFWQYSVFALDPLFGADPKPIVGIVGARASSTGFVFWDYTAIYADRGGSPASSPLVDIVDVALSGNTVYAALGSTGLARGVIGGSFAIDSGKPATSVWANDAGDLAIAVSLLAVPPRVEIKPVTTGTWQTLPVFGCTGSITAIGALALDELYVVRYCPNSANTAEIDLWDGSAWSVVSATPGFLQGPANRLGDNTLVFGGDHVRYGRGTMWTALPIAGITPAGNSPNDLWFGGLAVSPSIPAGLAHWDGATLASVRYPGNLNVSVIAVDKNTVFAASSSDYRTYARWAIP